MAENPFMSLPITDKRSYLTRLMDEQKQTDKNLLAGTKQGLYDLGDMGNKAWLNIAKKAGIDSGLPVKYDEYAKSSDMDKAAFDASPEGQSGKAQFSRFLANNLPYAVVPGGVAGGLLKRMLTGSIANMGIGAINDIADDNSFPINTLLGGAVGALIPGTTAIGSLATKPLKWAYDAVFPQGKVLSQTAKTIGDDLGNVINTKQAGERLGVHLTPAEASGNPLLAQMQGKSGTSEEGAKALYAFGKTHLGQQQSSIDDLLNEISLNPASAANDVRNAAKAAISQKETALLNKARPFYDEAYKREVPADQIKSLMSSDPNIESAVTSVIKDKRFAVENKGYSPNSIKILDQAKKRIDAQIEGALRDGDKHLASVLVDSKKRLISATDEFSDSYKMARSIYGEGAKPLVALKESGIGRIADLSDQQLKNVSKIIFDPAQTDSKILPRISAQINKQSPGAWNQIVRNEMERRLDKTISPLTGEAEGAAGVNFYNKILAGNRDFNQFLSAVKDIPGAQKKLIDMRAAFKNIINPASAKTAAALSKSSLDVPRSTMQAVRDLASNVLGGRHDKAFIEFITNPKWDTLLQDYMKNKGTKSAYDKVIKYGAILGKIGTGSMDINTNSNIPIQPTQLQDNPFMSIPLINKES